MAVLRPKNWSAFQHYKNRCPPWIKLHKSLLDDYEFQGLPLASRALAPMLWLLASEHTDGIIRYEIKQLSFRLRMEVSDVEAGISTLIESGHFVEAATASELLAKCERHAISETDEETDEETDQIIPIGFDDFWNAYPKKENRKQAAAAFLLALKKTNAAIIISAAKDYAKSVHGKDERYWASAKNWLAGERWTDGKKTSKTPALDAERERQLANGKA